MKRAGNNRSHITSNFSHLAAIKSPAIHNGSNLKCVKRMCARKRSVVHMHGKRATKMNKKTTIYLRI